METQALVSGAPRSVTSRKKFFLAFLVLVAFPALWIVYVQNGDIAQITIINSMASDSSEEGYLVSSKKCRIPNIDPFNENVKPFFKALPYVPCSKVPLLTYTSVSNNTATLHLDEKSKAFYTKNEDVSCCYSAVSRGTSKTDPDDVVKYSECKEFTKSIEMSTDIALVKCKDRKTKKEIYKNVHSVVTINDSVRKKQNNNTRHLSVLMVAIDSVSRLNFQRCMPKTHQHVQGKGWYELKGYNKMGDNTFPNVMAISTGYNISRSYTISNPTQVGGLDKVRFIWNAFRDQGFVTGYAEDTTPVGTFNYHKKGFETPPTDYYFRPYLMAAEKSLKHTSVDKMTYCVGPESAGERILKVAANFAEALEDFPYWGLFWMNSFSHNLLNAVSRMDGKVEKFLSELEERGWLENTILVFFSDHGIRFGEFRYTKMGWLEERLPFMYMKLPAWFEEDYPEQVTNLKINSNRLTTPYDLHMTLQHLLVLSGSNHTIVPSEGCPRCRSLFDLADHERSCQEAAIEQHWCTCNEYSDINPDDSLVQSAVQYIIGMLHRSVKSTRRCAKFNLKTVVYSSVTEASGKEIHLLVVFKTKPSAVFEATVRVRKDEDRTLFELQGSVSRLDSYESVSHCISDPSKKKYCYCL